jgi:hypothetical protein
MRALSVRAPWAGMIADGTKTLEVRSRRTRHRGELLICQSRGGGAVAIVEIVDCRDGRVGDEASTGGVSSVGQYVWELRLVRRVTSRPIKGRLGFYDVAESAFRPVGPG